MDAEPLGARNRAGARVLYAMTLLNGLLRRPTDLRPAPARNAPPMAASTDDRLIDRARNGDGQAFGLLVQRYQDAVYSLCYHLCGDRTDAEDLAQDAFVRFHRQLDRFRPGEPLWPWLRRLTTNSALNGLRGGRVGRVGRANNGAHTVSLDDAAIDGDITNVADTDVGGRAWRASDDLRIDLERHLQALAPADRAVLVLRYLEDLTYAEIAALLDVPVSTVETRLFRARKRLGALYRAHAADGEV